MLLAFAVTLASLGTLAQPSTSPNDSTIVVEGHLDRKRTATDYIDKLLPISFDEQFGRFEDRLCAGTVGLPAKLQAEVLGRIRRVATAAGLPLGGGDCKPNLLIIVVDDKKALIEGMRAKKQAYLYGVGYSRVRQLEHAPGPVAAWQVSDILGADGTPLRFDGDGFPRLFTTLPPSRLTNSTRKRFLGAVIVVEQRGLVGVTTRQLADYALVRAVTPIEPSERAAPTSSVLSLFDGGLKPNDKPQSLTWWDLAFLKALSATRSDLDGSIQRDEIRDRMLAIMSKIPAEQP